MISVSLQGGLGNQLFQIAAGYSLAKTIGTNFALDFESIIPTGQGRHPRNYKKNIFSKIPQANVPLEDLEPFREKGFTFDPIPLKDNQILRGYFQSEKYFKKYTKEIKSLFEFPSQLKKKLNNKFNFSKKKKIAVHIRRGDYLTDEQVFKVLPPLDVNYFMSAMKSFSSENVDFIIFSDDFDSLHNEIDLSYFTNLENENEIEDLYSISQCDGIVMSNSTFSWWGAWLGKKKYKIISPIQWYGPEGPSEHDLYFSDSIKI